MLNVKIINLKKSLMNYAELVEKMLQETIKGLIEKKESLLNNIIFQKEPLSNKYEIEFDEVCTNIIAQYQPVSKNLRTIIGIIKMSNDLERMADHCVNIATYSLELIKEPQIKELIDLPKMAEITNNMLKGSIEAFVNEDDVSAKNICVQDNVVDNLNRVIKKDLAQLIKTNNNVIENALKLIYISNNLERIADLSTNICEDIIYFSQGSVIKHHFDNSYKKVVKW